MPLLRKTAVESDVPAGDSFSDFYREAEPRLRATLVSGFGVHAGRALQGVRLTDPCPPLTPASSV